MARKVYISSDMSIDERLIEVGENNPLAALIWPWILTSFDDWGRSEANPKRLKAKIFPSNNLVTVDKIKKALQDYAAVGLIELYEIDDIKYMANLEHFKMFHRLARASKIPDPPDNNPKIKKYLEECKKWPLYPDAPWLKYRRIVFKRDSYKCVYCGSKENLTVDHIIPRSRGGEDSVKNLVTACFKCNRKKSDKTPEEAGMTIGGDALNG